MNGFTKKVLHLSHNAREEIEFPIEIDSAGDGTWQTHKVVKVGPGGYAHYEFPQALDARWVRVMAGKECTATAHFVYTAWASGGEGTLPNVPGAGDGQPQTSGALLPWANRLWHAHTGLFEIDQDLTMRRRPESIPGTFHNRLMLGGQLIIGPHVIDSQGRVKTIKGLEGLHLTAVMPHLGDRKGKAYFLSAEGMLYEADLASLEAKRLCDVGKELGVKGKAQFKGGFTAGNRVIVANSTPDDGRLAEWDGAIWTIIERKPFCEVAKAGSMTGAVLATGWDEASAILKVLINGRWSTYRLPKVSPSYDPAWGDWPRIREVETERLLMDCHGLFYEMSELLYEGKVWGLRPVAAHGRAIGEFCTWRGLLVMTGATSGAGTSSTPFWFGKTDDLWQSGKPKGSGGPLLNTPVRPETASDPYLMTGFDQKSVELGHDAESEVAFKIEVDFLGTGLWKTYDIVRVPARTKVVHQFPDAFSAHWVRISVNKPCKATSTFLYR
jgi:hypothetical protein